MQRLCSVRSISSATCSVAVAIIVFLVLGLGATTATAQSVTCSPSQLVVSKVFDCPITVLLDLTNDTDYDVTATSTNAGLRIDGGLGPVTKTVTTDNNGMATATFDIHCDGNGGSSGFITIDVDTFTCQVEVFCEPCATEGPGDITLYKRQGPVPDARNCMTFDLKLPGMACVSGKKMKAFPAGANFVCIEYTPVNGDVADVVAVPGDNVNGHATYTVCCKEGVGPTTEQVTYKIDPAEGLSACYDYSHKITCGNLPPTPSDGQNSAEGNSGYGYVVPEMPETGDARVSFDLVDADLTGVGAAGLEYYYGTPSGPNLLVAAVPLPEAETRQVHVDQPLLDLAPYFDGAHLTYFIQTDLGEILFVSNAPSIPTLSEWALIALSLLLVVTGGLALRRRTRARSTNVG